jgi:predicted PurR-regulated permease PerM
MENASKALIIAGAILISILIIAIGMYIYSSSTNSINEGIGSMSTQEKEAFNANWANYEGKQTGTQVKAMISKLISNANTYQEESGKVIGVNLVNIGSNLANITYNDLNTYVGSLNSLNKAIQARHVYKVSVDYSATTSLINTITISYN